MTRPATYSTARTCFDETQTGRRSCGLAHICSWSGAAGQQLQLPCPVHRMLAVVHPELAIDRAELALHRVRRDEQPTGNGHHWLPFRDRLQHPQFAPAELDHGWGVPNRSR